MHYIHIYIYIVPLKQIEYGVAYVVIRSSYSPYSTYLRGTIYIYVYTHMCVYEDGDYHLFFWSPGFPRHCLVNLGGSHRNAVECR